jgi:hypothetical protein
VNKIWLRNSFQQNDKVKLYGAQFDKVGDPINPKWKWFIWENSQAYLDGKLDEFLGTLCICNNNDYYNCNLSINFFMLYLY